jgi:isoleucyl-tRNA synthetase
MLLMVSQVELRPVDGADDSLEVEVTRAEGHKCPRCWRVVSSVSTDDGTEGLCDRCVGALATTA